MKRNLILLIAFFTFSSFGAAQEFSVGLRGGFLSIVGVQTSLRFSVSPTNTFETRVVFEGIGANWWAVSLEGLYHFGINDVTNIYLGAGVGSWTTNVFYACTLQFPSNCPSSETVSQAHLVFGFESSLSQQVSLFLETAPLLVFFAGNNLQSFPFNLIMLGINYNF